MSVSSDTSSISYVGNNSTTTAYVVPFAFFDSTDLKVYALSATGVSTLLTLTTNYTVSGGAGTTGSVTTTAAIPSTNTVIITRSVPYTQLTSFTTGDRLPAASIEKALDKLTMSAQQLSRNTLPDTAATTGSAPYVLGVGVAGAAPSWVPQAAANLQPNSITTPLIDNGAVTPEKLSTGGPVWDASGNLTAASFNGPVTGNVTGNLTGNVTGNVTGAGNSTFAGNVGIGTSSPLTNLHVISPTGARIRAGGGAGSGFEFSGQDVRFDLPAANVIAAYTSNVERLRIDNVGTINTQANPITNCPTTAKAWVNFNGTTSGTWAGGASTVSRTAGSTTATVTTTNAHGLTTGNTVWALTGVVAGAYTVTVLTATTFTITTVATTALSAVAITFQGSTIRSSYNVSSITKNGTGDYTVNFATAMVDVNYSVSGVAGYTTAGNGYLIYEALSSRSVSSVRFNSITVSAVNGDSPAVQLSVFGN